jgi:hypothetical protein
VDNFSKWGLAPLFPLCPIRPQDFGAVPVDVAGGKIWCQAPFWGTNGMEYSDALPSSRPVFLFFRKTKIQIKSGLPKQKFVRFVSNQAKLSGLILEIKAW